jgi:hypothetical protein
MNYDKEIKWINEANRAAKPRWDRMDWIERYTRIKGCSGADAREAWQMAKWLGKLEEPIV